MINKSILSKKSLGILIHPSSLPGESECGTFGEVAKNWIKKLAKHGITYWQILPLSPTDETGSPYSSPSSFALNPWFLDINELIDENFILISNKEELGINYEKNDYLNFEIANKLTEELGKHILKSWEFQTEQRKNNFLKWTKENSWVEDYSIFTVLREEFNKLPWWQWPQEFKQKDIEYLQPWVQKNSSALLIKKLIQWHLDRQWRSIRNTASSFGVKIIGDLPFYVSRDSVDVWSNKSLFSISKNGDLISGDLLTSFLSGGILAKKPNQQIILDVKSSEMAINSIEKQSGFTVISKTGHSLIKEKIKEINAPLAGEMSGHIFFNENWYGFDDAIYTALRCLQEINFRKGGLEGFMATLPKSFSSPEIRIECKEEEKFKIIENIKALALNNYDLSDLLLIDGVRAKTTIGWWLIRASNTQAALIICAESDTNENLKQLLNKVRNYLKLVGVKEISEKI